MLDKIRQETKWPSLRMCRGKRRGDGKNGKDDDNAQKVYGNYDKMKQVGDQHSC